MSPAPTTREDRRGAAHPSEPPVERRPVATLAGARTILAKDLRAELRTLEALPAMAIFAVTTLVVFRFAFDRTRLEGDLAAGVLVVAILLAAILGITRVFVPEREQRGLDGIRLAPVDRTALLWAKVGALCIQLAVLVAVVVPVYALFFGVEPAAVPPLLAVLALVVAGLAVAGSLIAGLALMTRARELLVPLILLPLLVPLVIAAAGALEPVLTQGGPEFERFGAYVAMLGAYDLLIGLVAWGTFDFIVED